MLDYVTDELAKHDPLSPSSSQAKKDRASSSRWMEE
jgi:hypothetical protein